MFEQDLNDNKIQTAIIKRDLDFVLIDKNIVEK